MNTSTSLTRTKATVAARLDEAGAVLLAKLSLGALAWGDKWFGGMTRNPWNVKEGSSGSSAGSASATAAVDHSLWDAFLTGNLVSNTDGVNRLAYAKVSKAERKGWQGLIESYLEGRPTLRAAVLLQDLRRDVSEDETLLIDWLHERGIPVLLAITKIDKLKSMRRGARLRELKKAIDLPAANVIATSAEAGIGLDELWKAIDATIAQASSEV